MDTLTPYPDVLGSEVVTPVAEAEEGEVNVLSGVLESIPTEDAALPAMAPTVLRDIICTYSWDCDTALRIVECESRFRPDAISYDGSSWGLWQINTIHAHRWPNFWRDWMKPEVNTYWAYEIYERAGGWSPWGCAR